MFFPKDDESIVPEMTALFDKGGHHLAERVYVLEQRRASQAEFSGSSFDADMKALRKSLSLKQLQANSYETETSDHSSYELQANKGVSFSNVSIREYP